MTKRALVAGGAGFIGSHLVEELIAHGYAVTVIDNFSTGRAENLSGLRPGSFELVRADIACFDDILPAMSGIDYVFHLAALADIVPSIERPLDYHRANVDGTIAVLEAARRSGVKKIVYAASSSCYGIPALFPTDEGASIRPQYPYALTKYLGEEYLLHWHKIYGIPAVSLRLFNVYGPRSRTSGAYGAVFGVFLAQKCAGKKFTVVGDGRQTRDFIFVKDVVRAFRMAAESGSSGEIFNVGSGRPQSVNRLVELLGGEKEYIPKRPGEPDITHADITKITKALEWKPETSFEDGVAVMLRHIDCWRQAPVWTPAMIARETQSWFKYLGR
ncbi:MAG: SDR family oxidoreductase [Candidatus Omnitrophica bacterium]|nr:SDR family oxidoreductase [Candidatus Omnitrophota bacterium]